MWVKSKSFAWWKKEAKREKPGLSVLVTRLLSHHPADT